MVPKDGWFIPQTLFDKKLNSVYLMVDLPLNRPLDLQKVVDFFKVGSKSAAIFYDAIPYKLSDIYPKHFRCSCRIYALIG